MELQYPIRRGLGQDPNGGTLTTIRGRSSCPCTVRARIRSGSEGYLYLGELYADTGRREKAIETLKKAEGAFKEMGMDYWVRRTQDVLERVEG